MAADVWYPGCGRPWTPAEEAALVEAGIKKPRRDRADQALESDADDRA